MRISRQFATAVAAAAMLLSAGCRHSDGNAAAAGEIAGIGDESLTHAELAAALPAGLSTDDSTRLAHAYIRNWVETRLAEDVAAGQVDMEEIDRLTARYRRDLIMQRYRDMMFAEAEGNTQFSDSAVAAYYERHSADFVLQRPLIRGVYVKLPDDAPELPAIRRLYRSTRPDDIDRLEKAVLGSAIHYDYFRDRWIDWEHVEARIPYDFGPVPADYVRSHRNLDVSLGGFTYLLEISDVLPAGSPMPKEAARPMIEERLLAERRRSFDATVRRQLFENALRDGTLRLNVEL